MNKNELTLLQQKQMFTEMLRKTSAEEVAKTCRHISIRAIKTAEMHNAMPYECVDCEDCCFAEDKHE